MQSLATEQCRFLKKSSDSVKVFRKHMGSSRWTAACPNACEPGLGRCWAHFSSFSSSSEMTSSFWYCFWWAKKNSRHVQLQPRRKRWLNPDKGDISESTWLAMERVLLNSRLIPKTYCFDQAVQWSNTHKSLHSAGLQKTYALLICITLNMSILWNACTKY